MTFHSIIMARTITANMVRPIRSAVTECSSGCFILYTLYLIIQYYQNAYHYYYYKFKICHFKLPYLGKSTQVLDPIQNHPILEP